MFKNVCRIEGKPAQSNNLYKKNFVKIYTVEDQIYAEYIRVVKTGSSEGVFAGPL